MTQAETPHVGFDALLAEAEALDGADRLRAWRESFVIADPELIYLDGNSLGRLPTATPARLARLVERDWGEALVRGWPGGWIDAPRRVGDRLGAVLGAGPGQVVACDSVSVNLYKLAMAALAARPERTVVVTDGLNFPSDGYVLAGCVATLGGGRSLRTVASRDGVGIDRDALAAAIDADTALVCLGHVAYKSGFRFDAAEITRLAQARGAWVLWDVSHSAGAVPVALDAWGADLAVGCTYKYLNGGPGAPGFLYVAERHQTRLVSPIQGWFGQHRPFDFSERYQPAVGIDRFLAGTPPIVSLEAAAVGIEQVAEAGVEALAAKAACQTAWLIELAERWLAPLGVAVATPREPRERGAHVSLRHAEAYRINRALIDEARVLPDFREPDVIRFGLSPLYTRYADIAQAVIRTHTVIARRRYEHYDHERAAVT